MVSSINAQNLIDSNYFCSVFSRARHAFDVDSSSVLNIQARIDSSAVRVTSTSPVGYPQKVDWAHSVSGYVGAKVLSLAEAHLAPYAGTDGNSLVFGREIDTSLLGGLLGDLDDVLAPVLSANALTNWSSSATISSMGLQAHQLYRVSFYVDPGQNVPVSLLEAVRLEIGNQGMVDELGRSLTFLNVLDLITLPGGAGLEGKEVSYTFMATEPQEDLELKVSASSVAGLGALGGAEGNAEVLSFRNFSVVAIPEPSVTCLFVLAGGCVVWQRRRKH